MCGIAGIAYFNKHKNVRNEELQLMSSKIAHRGPDDEGLFISKEKQVGLVSTRLAIIDLSKNGHMPMHYIGRYTIVFNGEIYNFKKLKLKLEKEGSIFKSNSDTEVILALYSRYKEGCLKYLRGMFAFAIYDSIEKTIFLARDRVGKKPLKYFLNDSIFIFSSELKAILATGIVKPEIDDVSIQKYLIYGYTPSPMTGFKGIMKLEPGHYLKVNIKNKIYSKKCYWKPNFRKKLLLTESEWSKKILATLEESVRLRMISDVPIGAFLSGGVDSSAVVAMMARNSLDPIKTFSVIYEDKNFNEQKYARNIAKVYKTDHTEILARPQNIEILPEIAYQYEEPFADASSLVTFMVSKETAKHVKVALNGDGGDENFAGYPNRYLRLKRDIDYAFWIQKIRPASALGIKRLNNFINKSKLPLYERFASYSQIFSISDMEDLTTQRVKQTYKDDMPYRKVGEIFKKFNGNDLKDAGLKFDLMYFLPDQLLAKVDIASMKYGLESRSPILDQKMVDLACKIPFNLKLKGGETKYIFKKALESIVPKENLYRKKVGFGVPLSEWFKGDLNPYARRLLLSKKSMIKDFIQTEKLKPLIDSKNLKEDFGPRIWSLMMLELWLQNYFT